MGIEDAGGSSLARVAARDPVKNGRQYAVRWRMAGFARKENTAVSIITLKHSAVREDKSSNVTNPRRVKGTLPDPRIQAHQRAEEEDEEEEEKEEQEQEQEQEQETE